MRTAGSGSEPYRRRASPAGPCTTSSTPRASSWNACRFRKTARLWALVPGVSCTCSHLKERRANSSARGSSNPHTKLVNQRCDVAYGEPHHKFDIAFSRQNANPVAFGKTNRCCVDNSHPQEDSYATLPHGNARSCTGYDHFPRCRGTTDSQGSRGLRGAQSDADRRAVTNHDFPGNQG